MVLACYATMSDRWRVNRPWRIVASSDCRTPCTLYTIAPPVAGCKGGWPSRWQSSSVAAMASRRPSWRSRPGRSNRKQLQMAARAWACTQLETWRNTLLVSQEVLCVCQHHTERQSLITQATHRPTIQAEHWPTVRIFRHTALRALDGLRAR